MLAVPVGIAGIALCTGAYLASTWRYRRAHESLTSVGVLPDGAFALFLIWFATLLVGVVSAGYLLTRALS